MPIGTSFRATIIPLMSQLDPLANSSAIGIGDITQSLFVSPANPGKLIWGVGPVFTIPPQAMLFSAP